MAATHAIVGATGAVGRALTARVINRGGVPLLIGRSADKLNALAKEHGNAPILVADCAAPDSLAEAFKGADVDMAQWLLDLKARPERAERYRSPQGDREAYQEK